MIRAAGRRAGDGDPNDVAELLALVPQLDEAIAQAVRELNEHHGYSWADIAGACGVTRQAAHRRWGNGMVDERRPPESWTDSQAMRRDGRR